MSHACYIGIDPGFTGGIAAIAVSESGAQAVSLFDMPTSEYSVTRVRGGKRQAGTETVLDTARIVTILEGLKPFDPFVLIERAQVRPANAPGADRGGQGVVSQAKFYGQYTEIRGVLSALRIPHETVHSATWKADMFHGQPKAADEKGAKELSRMKARELFPVVASRLELKKTHGLAEALLIAEYGRRRFDAPF